jgi:tRNA threonylcarbamoyl adenosine modification protein YjeE
MAESGAIDRAIALADEAATVRLAEDLALILQPGDVIALHGDLGMGKSTLARALLRAFADDAHLEVPSPTFTLVQTYDFPRLTIAHFDLYRLGGEDELDEIGFDEAIRDGAALIEWPERAEDALPRDCVHLHLESGSNVNARMARIGGPDCFMARLDRSLGVRAFLDAHGWGDCARRYLKADASTRRLERLHIGTTSRILLDHPPETTDAAGLARATARASAHLAEDVTAFVAIGMAVQASGFSTQEFYAHDLDQGLVLMEDFGHDFIAEDGVPVPERYLAAIEVLAEIHTRDWPDVVEAAPRRSHRLPEYDLSDFVTMLDPFIEWEAPRLLGRPLDAAAIADFRAAWTPALAYVVAQPKTWSLRDYHSPNLMWLPERDGFRRVGLLDFQDAALLHPAYDVASLAQDARVTISDQLEASLVTHYLNKRSCPIEPEAFRSAYAVLAAQRATRILGVFARLAIRDHRPDYLKHSSRIRAYLARSLTASALQSVRAWFERHVADAIVTVG